MPLGPIEVVVIGFPGGEVSDATLAELERLVEAETISVVDALYIRTDENGDVVFAEVDEPGANDDVARLAALLQPLDSLISDEDVDEFAAALEPGDSAAIIEFDRSSSAHIDCRKGRLPAALAWSRESELIVP